MASPRNDLSRRSVLAGGLALAATGFGGGLAPAGAAEINLTSFNRIGSWQMRYRTGYHVVGGRQIGLHRTTANQAFLFDPTFHTMCDSWTSYYNTMSLRHFSSTARIAWFGTAGVYVNKPGNHGTGNAFDLTAVYFSNGGYIDCLYSYQGVVAHRRWYIGLAWTARRFFPELGIVGSDASHANHVHLGRFKNGSSSVLLTRGPWDTWLVQRTCQVLMQVNIAIDGQWGTQTENFYRTLMSRLGLGGYNPFGNVTHLRTMADRIVAAGLAGRTV
jgi:hypothetical protein